MASSLTYTKAMCDPLEGGSGRGLTKLLEVVQHNWRCEKVEESWLVGKLRCCQSGVVVLLAADGLVLPLRALGEC